MTDRQKVLILGGTADGRKLASLCVHAFGPEVDIISSLAGRTRTARALEGTTRVGGFGGALGLAEYLVAENITALVDATHPSPRPYPATRRRLHKGSTFLSLRSLVPAGGCPTG